MADQPETFKDRHPDAPTWAERLDSRMDRLEEMLARVTADEQGPAADETPTDPLTAEVNRRVEQADRESEPPEPPSAPQREAFDLDASIAEKWRQFDLPGSPPRVTEDMDEPEPPASPESSEASESPEFTETVRGDDNEQDIDEPQGDHGELPIEQMANAVAGGDSPADTLDRHREVMQALDEIKKMVEEAQDQPAHMV